MHPFVLHNGRVQKADVTSLSPGQTGVVNGWGVFSTLRVKEGVMFAFERHWRRMQGDARLMRVPFPADPAELEGPLYELIQANDAGEATLRVIVVRNRGGAWEGPGIDRDYDIIAFTTNVRDWGSGVKLGLIPDARHAASQFAGTKILSWSHNLCWLEDAQARGLDEVILLNERGEVSECTSANLFVSQGQDIWTPPLTSGCLPGVTRQLLLSEVKVDGISVTEKTLLPADLEAADEVFITSTTRGLLPVVSVEGLSIRRDGVAREPVQAAFSEYVRSYVNEAKSLRRRSD
jgi:branched-chain amino acid aminotransferase